MLRDYSSWRGVAKNHIELTSQFTGLYPRNRLEVDGDRLLYLGVTNPFEDKIPLVSGITLDVALCGEFLLATDLDRNMYMRSPTRVRNRLEGPEVILPLGTGQKTSVPLEVLVELFAVASTWMYVNAISIHLPDFNHGVTQGVPLPIQDATREVDNLANCGSNGVIEDQKVVIRIQW